MYVGEGSSNTRMAGGRGGLKGLSARETNDITTFLSASVGWTSDFTAQWDFLREHIYIFHLNSHRSLK